MPAGSEIPVFVIVVQVCHPPVLGTVSGPVTLTPFTLTWNVPPALIAVTRTLHVGAPTVNASGIWISVRMTFFIAKPRIFDERLPR